MKAGVSRTPEERTVGLPDFPFTSRYEEVDGLRLAYLDEGEGPPVVFFHGEPTWSFLWRKVIPPIRDAGFRCIAPDYAGFGRSDKPTDLGFYTYDRHVELVAELLERLDLRGATAVVHDWGGPIGLRLAVEHADRFDRLVVMETGPFTGHQRMSDAWLAFRDFVRGAEEVPVGMRCRGGQTGRRRTARGRAPDPGPLGRGRSGPALLRRRAGLRPAELPAAATDRRRLPLPPGGRRARDRRDHRHVAPGLMLMGRKALI